MPHPQNDPRTVDSTEADITSIICRHRGEHRLVGSILRKRAYLARRSAAQEAIVGLYEAAAVRHETCSIGD